MGLTTEAEFAETVIEILQDGRGLAQYDELIAEIPNRISLTEEDLIQSETRPGEAIWQQRVRNITSHKKSPGNAIPDGKLISIPGGLALPGHEAAA